MISAGMAVASSPFEYFVGTCVLQHGVVLFHPPKMGVSSVRVRVLPHLQCDLVECFSPNAFRSAMHTM